MVAQKMGSQGGGSNGKGGTQTQTQTRIQTHDPKPNPLAREGSLYSLTLNEVQNQLGDLGKPLSSMNIDELLKTVFTAEASINQAVENVDYGRAGEQAVLGMSLNRQSSLTLSRDLSKKTVDEVRQNRNTLGEITLEDFLVKAGVLRHPRRRKMRASLELIRRLCLNK